jgi:outer membrane receptor protein involved in Fe transport
MSVVLQGRYANLSQDPAAFAITGFAPRGEIGPGPRGLSLSESEVTLSANVDHKFAGVLTFALSPEDTVSVEEAYGTLLAPLHGVTPRFGRFLSGIGYLNEQHAHTWDFVDLPLAYQAFLGGSYRTDGVQVKWLAPSEHFVELGAEAGNGHAFPGAERSKNGLGSGALFAHTGGDIGISHSWRAGVSYLRTRGDDSANPTKLAIADFVWKWAPNGNPRERNFKLQGEYFHQTQGEWKPKGGYVQAVYQFMPQWRAGLRYDRLDPAGGVPGADIFQAEPTTFKPRRSSVMLDWSPSEFSRLRLQFARSLVQPDLTDNQWFVQYILSLGAHGAHRY